MFAVSIIAKSVPYFAASDVYFVYTPFNTPNADTGTRVWETLANVAIFLGVVIVMTFFLVLLFKLKCYKVGYITTFSNINCYFAKSNKAVCCLIFLKCNVIDLDMAHSVPVRLF